MSSELMTQVEQVAVVDGVKLDSVSNILVGEHVAKLPFARARGRLYVLVEPQGNRTGWGGLSREIAQAVHDEYYESGGSVTAGLRRALERANQLLCDMNAAEARRAPRLAGISAVVLKGKDLFIAQTGPALVYVIHGDTTTRFPEDSPWLEMSPRQAMEEGYAPPLGLRPELSVDLFHSQAEVGDTIVLAESAVASMIDDGEIGTLFGQEDDAAAETRLQSLFRDKDISLLVIRAGAQDELDAKPVHRLTPLTGYTLPTTGPIPGTMTKEPGQPSLRESLRRLGGTVAWATARTADTGRVVWRRMLPGSDRSRIARERRRRSSGLTLTPQEPRRLSDDRLVLVGMIVGIVVLAMVVYGLVRWQSSRVQVSRYQRTIQSVQVKLAEAKSASDAIAARQALMEADVLLTRAASYGQTGKDTEELSRQLGEQLDALDKVVRLYWLPVLRSYEDTNAMPSRVLGHGIDIYVLDRGLGRIYKYLFNPLMDGLQELGAGVPDILLRTGDVRDNLTVGPLVDITWMPAGPGREWSSLIVLEASGALLEYEPSAGIKMMPAGPRSALVEARAIAGVEGRLLVLDAGANKILVYEPGSGSYDGEGKLYTNADLMLRGVVDMAIDGDVYLLYADGLIAKLRGGEQLPFELSGLQTRMSNPTALCVTPAQEGGSPGYIYVADAGNERILQFGKDGQFVRQFKPKRGDKSFADMTGLYVDETAGKILVLAGNRLLLANLPR